MIKIIKGAKVYSPEYRGVKDVLIMGDKIWAVEDSINIDSNSDIEMVVISGKNKILTPGFIDSHVHIIGGGGEGGFKTRIPEIMLSDITTGGVTTLVGVLGTDGVTRNLVSLLAKARGLEEEGITTFIYSGSYRIPVISITGNGMRDIIIVDKVIGVGEIAISDQRSSQPTVEELKRVTADARVGGILSDKAGIVNIHLGDGKSMLNMLFEIVENTEIPYSQFLPTHLNRNSYLFEDAIKYGKAGGFIDFTTSYDASQEEKGGLKASKALKKSLDAGVPLERITFSSDGQGSLPVFNEKKEFVGLSVGKVTSLFKEVKAAILEEKVPFAKAITVVTSNPANRLKLKNKGRIAKDFDADLVLLDENSLEIDTVIAKGKTMVQNKEIKIFGIFEK
jgi:beta-aspartyl-dipeptidase (metallo-type)